MGQVWLATDTQLGREVARKLPVVLADAGVENVNAQVDELIDAG